MLQQVYQPAYKLGGILQYPWHTDSHLTETSPLVTVANRQSLWDSWVPYWNQSAHLLIEKSPRHMTMTRYLQAIFTPHQTRFVVVLRHPFGAWHWAFSNRWEYTSSTCGMHHVVQWLKLYEDLATDLQHVQHAVVLQYEQLTNSSVLIAQALVDRLFTRVGLPPTVSISMDHRSKSDTKYETIVAQYKQVRPGLFDADGNYKEGEAALNAVISEHLGKLAAIRKAKHEASVQVFQDTQAKANAVRPPPAPVEGRRQIAQEDEGQHPANGTAADVEALIAKYREGKLQERRDAGRRRLLGYWGGERSEVKIHAGTTFEWADDWETHVDMDSPACKQLVTQLEARVNRFGYSLLNLRHYERPEALATWTLER